MNTNFNRLLVICYVILACLSTMSVCDNNMPNTEGYYNVKKELTGLGTTFWYTMKFEETVDLTTCQLGKMHLCAQATGNLQPFSPQNCTLSYYYQENDQKINFVDSDCNQDVAHKFSDNRIETLDFDTNQNQLNINFKSHGPTGGDYTFNYADYALFACGDATNAAPTDTCPKKTIFEYLSR